MSLIKRREVAELLNISPQTLDRLYKSDPDAPQPIRIGTAVRWNSIEVLEWLSRQEERAKKEAKDRARSRASANREGE